ncbi:hypothetical protein Cgig2_026374 [Carnegiea gigantea]|uniref:Ethylene insensitive 3-like DNA-binding domain-containing protein n=1 Tax=Carnegiea gigantea TaxID=171969 RepID=A0A9Q1Q5Q3_9CARY|nr:hypothetical protein Cgig2_026374 [Carnegiea gigantea]
MGICSGNVEFLSAPLLDNDAMATQVGSEVVVVDDYSDEEIDVDELERRMWRDKMRLKRLKEQSRSTEGVDVAKQRRSQEQARRKKMSRAQDGILKYMLKMMEVCKAQGFVYGIIPEKGKPVSGASDNLREWWKEKKPIDKDPSNVGVDGNNDRSMIPQFLHVFKGKIVSGMDFAGKRKAFEQMSEITYSHIYTCVFVQCPRNRLERGFRDRISRDNHQLTCPYRSSTSQFDVSNIQISEIKPAIYQQAVLQTVSPLPPNNSSQSVFNLSGIGVPQDGQKMISELMSIYDSNVQGAQTDIPENVAPVNQSFLLPQIGFKPNGQMQSQSPMVESSIPGQPDIQANHQMFWEEDGKFSQCKALKTSFEHNSDENGVNSMLAASFVLQYGDLMEDLQGGSSNALPKQDESIWYN